MPLPQVVNLFHSSTPLEAPFRSLMNKITVKDGQPPLCIIFDVFIGWATDVAKSCGTVSVSFTTGGAYGTAAYVSLWQHLPHRSTGEDEFCLSGASPTPFHQGRIHHKIDGFRVLQSSNSPRGIQIKKQTSIGVCQLHQLHNQLFNFNYELLCVGARLEIRIPSL
ncbi:unnamed protein product [Fraxinus pennsylvanica]|uniref:Uncharacterized protein n=1 Tax=Fraxinus pennsylvanica TaxID=56036 RepID=A0AAD1YWL6_9LAMI|nr:unnamed protein product [Fraxinus pennsylvanica]